MVEKPGRSRHVLVFGEPPPAPDAWRSPPAHIRRAGGAIGAPRRQGNSVAAPDGSSSRSTPAGSGAVQIPNVTYSCATLIYVTRNITFSLPEDLIRGAKILAVQRNLSFNALVKEMLEEVVKGRNRTRKAGERLLRKSEAGLYEIAPGSWNRAELHE